MLLFARHLFSLLFVGAAMADVPSSRVFLEEHCTDCHDAETKKGGLDLTALAWDLEERSSFDEWVKVFDLVSKGEMPPKKKARPEAAATRAFLARIGNELRAFDGKRQAENGRAVLRRLNRVEYERTMQDLLGISTPLAVMLPADTPMHGFDTVAEGLRLSTLQMEKYLEAADRGIDAAIDLGPEPERISKRYFFKDEKGVRANLDKPEGSESEDKDPKKKHKHLMRELPDAIVFFNEGYPYADLRQFGGRPAGTYRIRISGYGYQSKGQSIPMRVYTDNYREKQLIGWFEMPPDQPRVVEFTAKLPAHINLRIEPTNTGVDDKGQNVYYIGAKEFTAPGLALQWVEVDGPILECWPPQSMKNVFGDTPLTKVDDSKKKGDKRVAYEFTPADPKAGATQAIESAGKWRGRSLRETGRGRTRFRQAIPGGHARRFARCAHGAAVPAVSGTAGQARRFRSCLAPLVFSLEHDAG